MKRLVALVLACMAGCNSAQPPPAIEVLASSRLEEPLAGYLEDFTAETGIPVAVSWGESGEQVDGLTDKSGGPVDVIVTDNAADIWRAADRGALRPIESPALARQPAHVRDPDGYWGMLEVRPHAIYHHGQTRPIVASVQELGNADFAGRICLSSSRLAVNRSLIAYLIDANGVRETERLVRRWVRNLSHPPFPSEAQLLEAVGDGSCEYGIAGWGTSGTVSGATPFLSQPETVDISAVGVNRHAVQAESAQDLVDWLLRERAMRLPSPPETLPPAVRLAGWNDEEARLLAERAGYR